MDANGTPPSRRSCATSTTSPTASICVPTSSSDTVVCRPMYDEAAAAVDRRRWTTDRPSPPRVRDHGGAAACPRRGCRLPRAWMPSAGGTYHTGDWPAEGVDCQRAAGRRHRHRLVRRPGHPPGRAGGSRDWSSSSARPTSRCRPATRRSPSTRSPTSRRTTPSCESRRAASRNGTLRVNYDEPAVTAPPERHPAALRGRLGSSAATTSSAASTT